MNDTVVIGLGPAGVSAAIYLKRAGFNPVLVGKDLGPLEKSDKIENYYGFSEPVSGKALLTNGLAQAKRLLIPVFMQEVVSIEPGDDFFSIKTASQVFEAKTLLLATGRARNIVKIPGFEEFRGRGISFCATCDGFFYRGKKLGVLGSGHFAKSELSDLKSFTSDITLFTNGEEPDFEIPDDIKLNKEPIREIKGSESIETIVTAENEYNTNGLFVAMGSASALDFASKVGILLKDNSVSVDESFMTNIPGIFAAGDCTGGLLQIAKAVSDGARSAGGIINYLKSHSN